MDNQVVHAIGLFKLISSLDSRHLITEQLIRSAACIRAMLLVGMLAIGGGTSQVVSASEFDPESSASSSHTRSVVLHEDKAASSSIVNGTSIEIVGAIQQTAVADDQEGQGCSPGFWQQSHHHLWWVDYHPDDLFCDVFHCSTSASLITFDGKTLLEVITMGGGQLQALGRHTVAALLNAAEADVSYKLSIAEVIDTVNDAIASDQQSVIETTKDALEMLNEQFCTLPCIKADIDLDGVVSVEDLFILLSTWGDQPGTGDINNDGVTDVLDLFILLGCWKWSVP